MANEKYSIEEVKKEINKLTPKEKIKFIKEKLAVYRQWENMEGQNFSGLYFIYGFKADTEALLSEIEKDNSDSYSRDLNWFYNADNLPNQEAVFSTDNFLQSYRIDTFETLDFFNLLFKQIDELKDNLDTPIDFVKHLKELPYNQEQLHLLFAMIIYWHGGTQNFNPKYKTPLKLIEKEFLSFPEYTHEKKFLNYPFTPLKVVSHTDETLQVSEFAFPESHYYDKIKIDFDGLPDYAIRKGIIHRFEESNFHKDSDYKTWQHEWLNFIQTIPEQHRLKTIQKGIEYGEKAYQYHKEVECKTPQNCAHNESWERRNVMAQSILINALAEKKEADKLRNKDYNNSYLHKMLPDAQDKETVLAYLLGLSSLIFEFHCRARYGKPKSTLPEINLTFSGNGKLYEYVERDIRIVKQAITDNNPEIRFLNTYVLPPIDIPFGLSDKSLFENLLEEKYIDANDPPRYTSKKMYAKYEADRFENAYKTYFDFLPVSQRWFEYLKGVSEGKELIEDQIIEVPTAETEFTTARQVLAMHYLFDYCKIKNVDNTVKARFIQFLTGKQINAKKIQNTEIYKKVCSPFSQNDNSTSNDLQFIRKYFEDLGLSEIAKAITNEISNREFKKK